MNELIERIKRIIEEINRERGPFTFAALVDRSDNPVPGKYDLLVSAPWIGREKAFYEYLKPKLSSELRDTEWLRLARVLVLNPSGEFLREFQQVIGPVTKDRDVQNVRVADIDVRYAHLFATQPSNNMAHANA
jgi:hypothetical protein